MIMLAKSGIMTEITEALLEMYEKHKAHLKKMVEKHEFLESESIGVNAHREVRDAYANALDNITTLFGESGD